MDELRRLARPARDKARGHEAVLVSHQVVVVWIVRSYIKRELGGQRLLTREPMTAPRRRIDRPAGRLNTNTTPRPIHPPAGPRCRTDPA